MGGSFPSLSRSIMSPSFLFFVRALTQRVWGRPLSFSSQIIAVFTRSMANEWFLLPSFFSLQHVGKRKEMLVQQKRGKEGENVFFSQTVTNSLHEFSFMLLFEFSFFSVFQFSISSLACTAAAATQQQKWHTILFATPHTPFSHFHQNEKEREREKEKAKKGVWICGKCGSRPVLRREVKKRAEAAEPKINNLYGKGEEEAGSGLGSSKKVWIFSDPLSFLPLPSSFSPYYA